MNIKILSGAVFLVYPLDRKKDLLATSGRGQNASLSYKITKLHETGEVLSRIIPFFRSLLGGVGKRRGFWARCSFYAKPLRVVG